MDITPWVNFGWPVALLVLVLSATGVGLGWFLKAYLKQQKEEFDVRRADQLRKDNLLMEQHEFIRELASNAIKESSAALAQMTEIRGFMHEMTRSLTIINEQLHEHSVKSDVVHDALRDQHQSMIVQATQMERTAFKTHIKGAS